MNAHIVQFLNQNTSNYTLFVSHGKFCVRMYMDAAGLEKVNRKLYIHTYIVLAPLGTESNALNVERIVWSTPTIEP